TEEGGVGDARGASRATPRNELVAGRDTDVPPDDTAHTSPIHADGKLIGCRPPGAEKSPRSIGHLRKGGPCAVATGTGRAK
ncbi:MAG: hypothetical protein ACK55I_26885, partial [bacterium]